MKGNREKCDAEPLKGNREAIKSDGEELKGDGKELKGNGDNCVLIYLCIMSDMNIPLCILSRFNTYCYRK